jgi:hypothetical protein
MENGRRRSRQYSANVRQQDQLRRHVVQCATSATSMADEFLDRPFSNWLVVNDEAMIM